MSWVHPASACTGPGSPFAAATKGWCSEHLLLVRLQTQGPSCIPRRLARVGVTAEFSYTPRRPSTPWHPSRGTHITPYPWPCPWVGDRVLPAGPPGLPQPTTPPRGQRQWGL